MTSIAELQQFLPAGLHGPEWVGPVVLIFVAAGTWNAVRAPSPLHDFRPARLHAIASLCAIVLGVWIGVSIHPLSGAALLGAGCCLSLWSVLLSFGVTWRNHIRPGIGTRTARELRFGCGPILATVRGVARCPAPLVGDSSPPQRHQCSGQTDTGDPDACTCIDPLRIRRIFYPRMVRKIRGGRFRFTTPHRRMRVCSARAAAPPRPGSGGSH